MFEFDIGKPLMVKRKQIMYLIVDKKNVIPVVVVSDGFTQLLTTIGLDDNLYIYYSFI